MVVTLVSIHFLLFIRLFLSFLGFLVIMQFVVIAVFLAHLSTKCSW